MRRPSCCAMFMCASFALVSTPALSKTDTYSFKANGRSGEVYGASATASYHLQISERTEGKPGGASTYSLTVSVCSYSGNTSDCLEGTALNVEGSIMDGSESDSWIEIRIPDLAPQLTRQVCDLGSGACSAAIPATGPLGIDLTVRALGNPEVRSQWHGNSRDEFRFANGTVITTIRNGGGSSTTGVRVSGDLLGLPLPLVNADSASGAIGTLKESIITIVRSPR